MSTSTQDPASAPAEDRYACVFCKRVLTRDPRGFFMHDRVPHPAGSTTEDTRNSAH